MPSFNTEHDYDPNDDNGICGDDYISDPPSEPSYPSKPLKSAPVDWDGLW